LTFNFRCQDQLIVAKTWWECPVNSYVHFIARTYYCYVNCHVAYGSALFIFASSIEVREIVLSSRLRIIGTLLMLQADVNLSKLPTQTIDNIDETILRRSCSNSHYSNTNFDVAVRCLPLSNSHYSNNANLDVAVRCRPWSNTRYSNNSNFDVAVHSIILAIRIKHHS
jgi:hypothetical protein